VDNQEVIKIKGGIKTTTARESEVGCLGCVWGPIFEGEKWGADGVQV